MGMWDEALQLEVALLSSMPGVVSLEESVLLSCVQQTTEQVSDQSDTVSWTLFV